MSLIVIWEGKVTVSDKITYLKRHRTKSYPIYFILTLYKHVLPLWRDCIIQKMSRWSRRKLWRWSRPQFKQNDKPLPPTGVYSDTSSTCSGWLSPSSQWHHYSLNLLSCQGCWSGICFHEKFHLDFRNLLNLDLMKTRHQRLPAGKKSFSEQFPTHSHSKTDNSAFVPVLLDSKGRHMYTYTYICVHTCCKAISASWTHQNTVCSKAHHQRL